MDLFWVAAPIVSAICSTKRFTGLGLSQKKRSCYSLEGFPTRNTPRSLPTTRFSSFTPASRTQKHLAEVASPIPCRHGFFLAPEVVVQATAQVLERFPAPWDQAHCPATRQSLRVGRRSDLQHRHRGLNLSLLLIPLTG